MEFDKIRWEGGYIPGASYEPGGAVLQVVWGSTELGFTGASKHNPFKLDPNRLSYGDPEANKWMYWGHSILAIWSVDPNDVSSIGFYFSPAKAGIIGATYIYDVIGFYSVPVKLTGNGVADDSQKPVLGLDITPLVNNKQLNETTDINGITDIPITNNNEVVFIVNPVHRKDVNNKPIQLPTNVEKQNYVMVEVFASTKPNVSGTTTECSKGNGRVFLDTIQGPQPNPSSITFNGEPLALANGLEEGNYYQAISGDQGQPTCDRYYYFLVSLGSSFKFSVKKNSIISSDYVEYTFFIRGHYDFDPKSQKYPGSHKTFRLSTSEGTVTPIPKR